MKECMYHLISILREVKMFFLLFFLFLQTVRINGEQQGTIENAQFQLANETETSGNQTIPGNDSNQALKTDVQRITQPIAIMGRNMMEVKSPVAENTTEIKNTFADFKPSPHLGSFYEHNTFPVRKAFAEAKTFGSHFPENSNIAWPNNNYNVPTWTEKQNIQSPYDYNIWTENPKENHQELQKLATTSAPPWVQFPNAIPVPYQFVLNHDHSAGTAGGFAFNKPVQGSQTLPKSTPGFWDKLLGFGRDKSSENKPNSQQKTIDYNLLEAPPHQSFYELQGPGYGGLGYQQLYGGHAINPNPWKKIIKALATIIPIGLFISALTPTVITVSSSNDTSQSRYRLENSPQGDVTGRLSSSLSYFRRLNEDGCEDRVLCELLVSASFSKNAERDIRNLLDNFVNQEDIQNKKENLLKIFEAVKNQNCSPILCGNIKNPT